MHFLHIGSVAMVSQTSAKVSFFGFVFLGGGGGGKGFAGGFFFVFWVSRRAVWCGCVVVVGGVGWGGGV